jgi:hypothetical protein
MMSIVCGKWLPTRQNHSGVAKGRGDEPVGKKASGYRRLQNFLLKKAHQQTINDSYILLSIHT